MKTLSVVALLLASTALAQSEGVDCKQGSDCRLRSLVVDGTTTLTGAVTGGGAITGTSATISGPIVGTSATISGAVTGTSFTIGTKPMSIFQLAPSGRKCAQSLPVGVAATALTHFGLPAPSVVGTASAQSTLTGATKFYVQQVNAAATTNLQAGLVPTANGFRGNLKPTVAVNFRWAGEANVVLWVGVAETGFTTGRPTTGPTADIVDHLMIAYSSAQSAAFRCCSSDGTNHSCVDFPSPLAAGPVAEHEYLAYVDTLTESGVAGNCTLWDLTAATSATVRKTTHLINATNGVNLMQGAYVVTTEDVVKNNQVADMTVCWN